MHPWQDNDDYQIDRIDDLHPSPHFKPSFNDASIPTDTLISDQWFPLFVHNEWMRTLTDIRSL